MTEWRPISTAPKDGTPIDVLFDPKGMTPDDIYFWCDVYAATGVPRICNVAWSPDGSIRPGTRSMNPCWITAGHPIARIALPSDMTLTHWMSVETPPPKDGEGS